MPLPLMAIGAGISAISSLGKAIFGAKQNKLAKAIKPVWQQYQTNPFAKNQLGLAQQMMGGRMAGAPQLERNIMSAQGNTLSNVNRNATDASQALAYGAAAQGQTDASLGDLQVQEAQNKYSLLNNLNQAYGQMIGEGDKEYNSKLQKYQMDVAEKNALRDSGTKNIFGGVNDLASMSMQLGMMGGNTGQTNRQVTNGLNSGGVTQRGNMQLQNSYRTPTGYNSPSGQNWGFNPGIFSTPGLQRYLNRPR